MRYHYFASVGSCYFLPSLKQKARFEGSAILLGSGSTNGKMRFNNDSGSTYSFLANGMGGSANTSNQTQNHILVKGASTTAMTLISFLISNIAAYEKSVQIISTTVNAAGLATDPSVRFEQGKWANTSAEINRIDIIDDDTGDYVIGSDLIIEGLA